MGLKPDTWIAKMARDSAMIEPFVPRLVSQGVVSYGLSSFGYDIRVADLFLMLRECQLGDEVSIDPKKFDQNLLVEHRGTCVIPPNSFALAKSFEYIRMPDNVLGIVMGKSTYARCGVVLNVTPLEPGWEGYITLEISNTTPYPVVVYANEGIGQILFFEGDGSPSVTYASRKGKYQGQQDITLPKVL